MCIRFADTNDIEMILEYDRHIAKDELNSLIKQKRVFIAEEGQKFCGWLRYGLFWDNTPFTNMLYILQESRKRGYGKKLVEHWENEMKRLAYKTVMTSSVSAECAQHFYMRLGYKAIGGFLPEGAPYEIILAKTIQV